MITHNANKFKITELFNQNISNIKILQVFLVAKRIIKSGDRV